jgi:parallel beta-helix repeat protein
VIKEKMKKHIIAILIAIAVISGLLTVNVLSEEAYKPIIQSVTVSPTEIVDDGKVTFTVIAKSNAPVNWLNYRLYAPNGKILDGDGSAAFTNIGDDLWKFKRSYSIAEWASRGTYTYRHILVMNEGGLTSREWKPVSYTVRNNPVIPPKSTTIWYVDDDGGADFTKIQDAINVAKSGETIIVRNGTYTEKVEVYVNNLTIKSENGSASTIVQTSNSNDPVFEIMSDDVTIRGFTVTRSGKAGISLYYADHCTISNNSCSDNSGDGIILRWSNSNRIMNNTCSKNAYGIYLMESNVYPITPTLKTKFMASILIVRTATA